MTQVSQGLVDFADRAEDIFLEDHREILVGSYGVVEVGPDIPEIFEGDTNPQHGNDDDSENGGTSSLCEQLRQMWYVQLHSRVMD